MFDISALAYSIGINPGWFGVALGIVLFIMGRWHGKQIGYSDGAEQMIFMLEENGFLKVKRKFTDDDGNQHVEYAKYDE